MLSNSTVKSSFSVALKLIGSALAFYFYALISRSMSLDKAGVFFFMIAFSLAASNFSRLGFDNAILKYVSQKKISRGSEDWHPVYQAFIFSIFFSFLIVAVIIYFLDKFLLIFNLDNGNVGLVCILLFSIVPTTLYNICVPVLNGLERNVLASFVQTGAFQIIVVFLIFIFDFFPKKYSLDIWYGFLYFLSSFLVAFFSIIMCLKCSGRASFKGVFLNKNYELIKNSIYFFPGAIFDLLINIAPSVLLGFVSTTSEVAKFSVSQRIANVVYFIFASVNTVFSPKIGKNIAINEEIRSLYFNAVRLMLFSIFPVVTILVFLGKEVLFLFGSKYVDGYFGFVFLISSQMVHAIFGPVLMILIMAGMRKKYSYVMFIGAFFSSFFVLLLGSWKGAAGAAIGVFIGILIQKSCGFFFARKYIFPNN